MGGWVEERAVRFIGLGVGKHEPRELSREVARSVWDGESPAMANGSESKVIGVNREVL